MVGDHYEVKVDGEWTPVPNDKINNVIAPDGGAHVCAPRQLGPCSESFFPLRAEGDPPPLKWSDLRYVFDIKEDCNGKEAIQA
jgi:hypothetical protein